MPADLPASVAHWLSRELGRPGPFRLSRIGGGNSNETFLLEADGGRWVLRRPPAVGIARSGHSMQREYRVLQALTGQSVPAPRALAYCADSSISPTPLLVMEFAPGEPLTDRWPAGWRPDPDAVATAVIEALVAVHRVDWRAVGLGDFGRPEGFLARQVPRWRRQYEGYRCREVPWFDAVAEWLEENRPPEQEPALLHGDFHLDNCLLEQHPRTRVRAIIDWETATIGDPLVDLGLLLAFWGADRPVPPAMPRVQAVSREASAPSREELARRYAEMSGRSVEDLHWYMALAFFKLAAIVEGAYAQYVAGVLSSEYARALYEDVPRLLEEAARFAGLCR
jgi:aminoglycoside phosphotransferase (APT) family kinase protein